MIYLTLLYARSWTVGGALIRAAQWFGRYSHAAILTPEGTVIDATAFNGVREQPFDLWARRYSHIRRIEIECPRPEEGIAFARSQIGAGYDYRAVMNFVLRKLDQDKTRWHCVEFVETAVAMAGRARFREDASRITPHQSYSVI